MASSSGVADVALPAVGDVDYLAHLRDSLSFNYAGVSIFYTRAREHA